MSDANWLYSSGINPPTVTKQTAYSDETKVYHETGMNTTIVKSMSKKSDAEVTILINGYIKLADQRIRHLIAVPWVIRKEYHVFHFNEMSRPLGPWEDEYGFFGEYDPTNMVEKVYALFSQRRRLKIPFPKQCDELTEDVTCIDGTSWGVDDIPHSGTPTTIVAKDTTDFVAGTASLKFTVIATHGGMAIYPALKNLQKAQYPWDYISFWMKTSDPEAKFTITIYDNAGRTSTSAQFHCGATDFNMKYTDLNPAIADTWQIVALKFMMFPNYTAVNWVFVPVQYFTISVDRPCIFKIDNLSWNDGLFFTNPQGLICWSRSEVSPIDEEVEVTYSFDPFKTEVPEDISVASAKIAGIKLLEYLIGLRQRATAFVQSSDAMQSAPDKETLEFTKARLEREVESLIAAIGFKVYAGSSAEG